MTTKTCHVFSPWWKSLRCPFNQTARQRKKRHRLNSDCTAHYILISCTSTGYDPNHSKGSTLGSVTWKYLEASFNQCPQNAGSHWGLMSEFHQVHLPCCDLFTLSPFPLHNILVRYHRASQCVDKYKALCQATLFTLRWAWITFWFK